MEDNNDKLLDEKNEAGQAHPQDFALPQDIQHLILASLPGRLVLKRRRVCRFWRDCIEEPGFIDRHLSNALRFHKSIACFTSVDGGLVHMYTFDPTTMNFKSMDLVFSCRFQMSGPCNGLVCSYDLKGAPEVFNPTTRKHLELPVSEIQSQSLFSEYFLGFVQSTKQYKVVGVCHRVRSLTFEVCTVGTLSWRAVRESADLLKSTKAVIVNDVMHWLLLDEASSHFTRKILLLNLTDEKFSETSVPDAVKDRDLELFEGEGKLHLWSNAGKGSASTVSEIWVANSTCQVWMHMHTIYFPIPAGMRPLFLHKKKLFYSDQIRFSYFDLQDGSDYYVSMPFGESIISSGVFVESFLVPSVTGLVNSTTSAQSSHHGAGSSSVGPGNSSALTGWSLPKVLQSFKQAKRKVNMEWRMTRVA